MTTKDIALLKSEIKKGEGVVILPMKKWQKMQQEKQELAMAMEAIISGEIDLARGNVRTFKEFYEERHAKNK